MSFTTEVGTSSFNGCAFWILQEGTPARGLPRFGTQEVINEIHVPGGDRNIIQLLGGQTLPLQLTVVLKNADLPTFLGLRGTTGTLALLGDTPRQALLLTAGQPRTWAEGFAMTQATFRSLG